MKNDSIICLMGLTGAGKTALAMALYDKFPLEIISVDSAMIYKGMDIGSAKPEPELLERYPHHLVDIISPRQSYNAAQFVEDVTYLIQQIFKRGNRPLLVGGTMLYFKALQQGLNELPETTPELREKLNNDYEQFGLEFLYEKLCQCDPQSAERINSNDRQRIQRALEIFELSGKPMSNFLSKAKNSSNYSFVNIALVPQDRKLLHANIEKRFDLMLEQGFEDEVRALKLSGLTAEYSSMRCVGYKQMLSYLEGECSFDEMRFKAIAATRQLAKRQHTWLRKWPNLNSFEPCQENLTEEVMALLARQ